MKNILITAIGSFSARSAVESLRSQPINKLIGCDIYPSTWHNISHDLDLVLKSPYVSEENEYLEFILKTAERYNIDFIIPLIDPEVDFFNKYRSVFEEKKITIAIGNPTFLSIARNKYKLSEFIKNEKLPYIPTYHANELEDAQFPVLGKIINGRSSEGIIRLDSNEDILSTNDYSNYIFQEIMDGPIYTVDYIRNSTNNSFYLVPRLELKRTVNGAGLVVEVIYSESLKTLANNIGVSLDIHGCVNMEFIENNKSFYLIDINPRFSAGVGFSKLAGYDMVENMYSLYKNNTIDTTTEYLKIIAEKKMIEVINQIKE